VLFSRNLNQIIPYIALFLGKIVKFSDRWRFRPQTASLLLTRVVSETKLSKRAILSCTFVWFKVKYYNRVTIANVTVFAFSTSSVARGGTSGETFSTSSGASGGTWPGRKPWWRINTLFNHLKTRNLEQSMPKKCVFFGKKL